MNKRQKKKALVWWGSLDIQGRDEYYKTVIPKGKNHYNRPSQLEKEKMYIWANK